MSQLVRLVAYTILSAVATVAGVELAKWLREQYAADLEVRLRSELSRIMAARHEDDEVRKDFNRLMFEVYYSMREARKAAPDGTL